MLIDINRYNNLEKYWVHIILIDTQIKPYCTTFSTIFLLIKGMQNTHKKQAYSSMTVREKLNDDSIVALEHRVIVVNHCYYKSKNSV